MAEQARQSQQTEDNSGGGKKRKGSKKASRAAKKQKKNDASAAALKSAQDKHKAITGSSSERPIFIQPPLLANGCVLKDYQLEGVRWLTSLFENGVSGILADEMVRLFFQDLFWWA